MSDLISGGISAGVGIAATNAGGKLLKVKEMEMKYGIKRSGGGCHPLELVEGL